MIDIRKEYSILPFEAKLSALLRKSKKETPLVAIQGGYGKNNLGDDALLLTITEKIKQIVPNCRIVALCHYPERVKKYYGIDAVYFTDKQAIALLLKCDVLIIGGGGIVNKINTYSGFTVFKIFDMKGKFLFLTSLFTKMRRKPVVFYGVGMTSIPDKAVEWLMNITLNKVDLISVRDGVSFHYANKIIKNKKRLFYTHDPALNYTIAPVTDWKEECKEVFYSSAGKKLLINIRPVSNQNVNESVIQKISEFIVSINRSFPDLQIILLPVSLHPEKKLENDLYICQKIYKNISKNVKTLRLVKKYFHPGAYKKIFSMADFIIMTRLHGVILSYDYHVPTVVLSYDDKVKLFAQMAEYPNILDYETFQTEELIEIVEKQFSEESCK